MYGVPAAPEMDKRLRRAIGLALGLGSISIGFLMNVLVRFLDTFELLLSLGAYLGLLRICWLASVKASIKWLYVIAVLSVLLGIGCLIVIYVPAFHFRRDSREYWWSVFIMPVSLFSMSTQTAGWFISRIKKLP